MPRTPSPLLLVATLGVGAVLGLMLGRSAPPASAQSAAAPPVAALPPPTTPADEPRSSPPARPEDDDYRALAEDYDRHFRAVERTYERVARTVAPAVVHIVARKSSRRERGQPYLYEETGSGVIVRPPKGQGLYVLTNHHVVEGAAARDIQVGLHDGRVLRPERVHADPSTDIAVLKLGADDLPTARLGDSDAAAVGTWVLAMGSPFGLTHSVTQGIISAKMRHEDELETNGNLNQEFLQTDAAINPGNSGGPLVNMKGEVIGINTAIASSGGGSEGVGFSIPINLARWAMAQLVAAGKVSRGAVGVRLQNLEAREAADLGLDRPRGARIQSVQAGGPASSAGVRDGDVVLDYNGIAVVNSNQLINLISMTPIGQTADLVLWRDRKRLATRVVIMDRDLMLAQEPTDELAPTTPGAPLRRPARPGQSPAEPTAEVLGLELVTLDPTAARRLGLPEATRGVAVAHVDPGSPLARSLRPLDVISTVAGRSVRSADEAARALGKIDEHAPVELGLQREVDGMFRNLTVRVP